MKAFPENIKLVTGSGGIRPEFGMDLRDYFAAKAMQGFMGSCWDVKSFEQLSIKAYELADAMMKAKMEA